MKQDMHKQQADIQQDMHKQMRALNEQHQALAEQSASLFQSYEFDGVNRLLTNLLGASNARRPSAHTSPLASNAEVSPDRWSCASTVDGCRNSASPPDVTQHISSVRAMSSMPTRCSSAVLTTAAFKSHAKTDKHTRTHLDPLSLSASRVSLSPGDEEDDDVGPDPLAMTG